MRSAFFLLLAAAALLPTAVFSESPASTPEPDSSHPEPPVAQAPMNGKTVIRSDRLDVINTEEGNRFIFSGSVSVAGDGFTARCDRMEVRTDSEGSEDFGAISLIEAQGGVIIEQGERIATAGHAFIYPQLDRVVLEDDPKVEDTRGSVSGYRMVLEGEDRKIVVEKGPDGEQPRVELPSLESIKSGEADD